MRRAIFKGELLDLGSLIWLKQEKQWPTKALLNSIWIFCFQTPFYRQEKSCLMNYLILFWSMKDHKTVRWLRNDTWYDNTHHTSDEGLSALNSASKKVSNPVVEDHCFNWSGKKSVFDAGVEYVHKYRSANIAIVLECPLCQYHQ